jgi:hypothetical protein
VSLGPCNKSGVLFGPVEHLVFLFDILNRSIINCSMPRIANFVVEQPSWR